MKYTVTDIWTALYIRHEIEASCPEIAIADRLHHDYEPDEIDTCSLLLGWAVTPDDGGPVVCISAIDDSQHPDVNGLCRVLGES